MTKIGHEWLWSTFLSMKLRNVGVFPYLISDYVFPLSSHLMNTCSHAEMQFPPILVYMDGLVPEETLLGNI